MEIQIPNWISVSSREGDYIPLKAKSILIAPWPEVRGLAGGGGKEKEEEEEEQVSEEEEV